VAPLRLGGLRGKQSTPSVWLGGTGELSTVGERERRGERDAARSAGRLEAGEGNGMILISYLMVTEKKKKKKIVYLWSTTINPFFTAGKLFIFW
jgi:hypothetical protein